MADMHRLRKKLIEDEKFIKRVYDYNAKKFQLIPNPIYHYQKNLAPKKMPAHWNFDENENLEKSTSKKKQRNTSSNQKQVHIPDKSYKFKGSDFHEISCKKTQTKTTKSPRKPSDSKSTSQKLLLNLTSPQPHTPRTLEPQPRTHRMTAARLHDSRSRHQTSTHTPAIGRQPSDSRHRRPAKRASRPLAKSTARPPVQADDMRDVNDGVPRRLHNQHMLSELPESDRKVNDNNKWSSSYIDRRPSMHSFLAKADIEENNNDYLRSRVLSFTSNHKIDEKNARTSLILN